MANWLSLAMMALILLLHQAQLVVQCTKVRVPKLKFTQMHGVQLDCLVIQPISL